VNYTMPSSDLRHRINLFSSVLWQDLRKKLCVWKHWVSSHYHMKRYVCLMSTPVWGWKGIEARLVAFIASSLWSPDMLESYFCLLFLCDNSRSSVCFPTLHIFSSMEM
jgi:hypothetical protein